MAGIRTKINNIPCTNTMEFICDTVDEVQDAPTTTEIGKGVFADYDCCAPIGSMLIVGNEGGDVLIYMLFSFGWKQI